MKILNRSGPFICDKCERYFTSRKYFQKHFHHKHRNPSMLCDLCPRSFNQKRYLVNHLERDHLKARPFECDLCNFRGFRKSSLKGHMLQHSPKTECTLCHKLVANLRLHLDSHIKLKCPVCSQVISKSLLNRHIRNHGRYR